MSFKSFFSCFGKGQEGVKNNLDNGEEQLKKQVNFGRGSSFDVSELLKKTPEEIEKIVNMYTK